jgi:hypothetical protein
MSNKIKRGTKLIYNGQTVEMERDREDGTALIRMGTMFEDVDVCDLEPVKKVNKPINKVSDTKKEKTEREKLNDFFAEVSLKMPYECENCGQPLQAFNKFGKRSCTAHILPKSGFPSVAMNADNILFMGAGFLGGCSCHDRYDAGIEQRSKMKVYQVALKRFELLKPFLPDLELIRAYSYLNIKWQ